MDVDDDALRVGACSLAEALASQASGLLNEDHKAALQEFRQEVNAHKWELEDVTWIQSRLKGHRMPIGHSTDDEKATVSAARLQHAAQRLDDPYEAEYAEGLVTLVCALDPESMPLERP